MKIASRNVNGIRAVTGKGFYNRVKENNRDVICLQETKAFEHQLPAEFRYHMNEYNRVWHSGEKPGYAGTATLYKKNLNLISSKSHFEDIEKFHEDGRVVETKFVFGHREVSMTDEEWNDVAILDNESKIASLRSQWQVVTLLNIYFPNGWERADGTEMLSYKLEFYEHLIHYINKLRDAWEKIIVTWDFNICHKEIDIARPKENENSIWFLPIERAEMDKMEENGYVDTFRHFNPELRDQYTWWSYRAGARPRNVWRRLDYFWVSKDTLPLISWVQHQVLIEWSDHCPISLELI